MKKEIIMDLEKYYDKYWDNKRDEIDHNRINMILRHVESGKDVLEINCGLGILAEKMSKKGANVTVTDLSDISLHRARSRGLVKTFKMDIDTQKLPFESCKFDTVVSNSMIEHFFFPENTIKEAVRVLKYKGIFIVMVPNIGHIKFRLWLLLGRFPYLENTPTDILHLRFFTVHSLKKLGKNYGLKVKKVEGNSGLWVRSLYPMIFRIFPMRHLYKLFTVLYPSLFCRDILIVFEKNEKSEN